jgi:hypothetical protein
MIHGIEPPGARQKVRALLPPNFLIRIAKPIGSPFGNKTGPFWLRQNALLPGMKAL